MPDEADSHNRKSTKTTKFFFTILIAISFLLILIQIPETDAAKLQSCVIGIDGGCNEITRPRVPQCKSCHPNALFYANLNVPRASYTWGHKEVEHANLKFIPGRKGKATMIEDGAYLKFKAQGNIIKEKGTISFWYQPNWVGSKNETRPIFQVRNAANTKNNIYIGKHYHDNAAPASQGYLYAKLKDSPGLEVNTVSASEGVSEPNLLQTLWPGQWMHITLTWNLNPYEMKLYVNGVLIDQDTGSAVTLDDFDTHFYVGSTYNDIATDGAIDELRIYARQLSQQEIIEEYNLDATVCQNQKACQFNNECYDNIYDVGADPLDGKIRSIDANNDVRTDKACSLVSGTPTWRDCNTNEFTSGFCNVPWAKSGENIAFGSYTTQGTFSACGDDPSEFVKISPYNANDIGCCDSPTDGYAAGNCYASTATLACGEIFGECDSVGEVILCGDNNGEAIITFDADEDACEQEGTCDDAANQKAVCCSDASDCVHNGICYDALSVIDLDPSSEVHKAICNDNWYDLDTDDAICISSGFDWIAEGEEQQFGEYGNSQGGDNGIYADKKPEYTVKEQNIVECCGDDSGEYVKTDGSTTLCCSADDETVVNGECVPANQNLRDQFYLQKCITNADATHCSLIQQPELQAQANYILGSLLDVSYCNNILDQDLQDFCIERAGYFAQGSIPDTKKPSLSYTGQVQNTVTSCTPYQLHGTVFDKSDIEKIEYTFVGSTETVQGTLLPQDITDSVFHKALYLPAGTHGLDVSVHDSQGNIQDMTQTWITCPGIYSFDASVQYNGNDHWSGFFEDGFIEDDEIYLLYNTLGNNAVKIFNRDTGALLDTINIESETTADQGKTLVPRGVTVANSGDMYVAFIFDNAESVEDARGGVYQYDSNHNFVQQIGSYDSADFNYIYLPKDIEIKAGNEVVVLDTYATRADKFLFLDLSGNYNSHKYSEYVEEFEITNGIIYALPDIGSGILRENGNNWEKFGMAYIKRPYAIEAKFDRLYVASLKNGGTWIYVYDAPSLTLESMYNYEIEGIWEEILVDDNKLVKVGWGGSQVTTKVLDVVA